MIDAHAHLIPPDFSARVAADGDRLGVRLRPDNRVEFASGEVSRPIQPRLLSAALVAGCDVQIVSPWVDLFGYGLDPERGAGWARLLNTAMRGRPALATVPLQDGAAAADELHWALGQGFLGAEIGSNVNGRELSDPGLEPFWTACAETRAAVFIHPAYTIPTPRVSGYYLHNLVANPLDTTLAAAQLVFGGVLDRHQDLVVLLAHGGGYWPYQFGRFDRGYAVRPECRGPAKSPRGYLRAFYYDTIVHSPEALRYLVGLVGADRVVLGTDSPFDMRDPLPAAMLDAAGLTLSDRQTITRSNAEALFRLKKS